MHPQVYAFDGVKSRAVARPEEAGDSLLLNYRNAKMPGRLAVAQEQQLQHITVGISGRSTRICNETVPNFKLMDGGIFVDSFASKFKDANAVKPLAASQKGP